MLFVGSERPAASRGPSNEYPQLDSSASAKFQFAATDSSLSEQPECESDATSKFQAPDDAK